jgi:hypothetical protein
MADFPNIEPDLEEIALIANNQTYDSILTGEFQSAGLSGAKWQCTPTFSNRNGKEARDLRAFIFNQEGVTGRFNYYPASIDNLGTHAGQGVVDGAGQVGKSLVTKGWDTDQELLFAAGDYLTVNGEMKMVTADVSVGQDYIEYDGTNYVSESFDPEGWTSSPSANITNIPIENPSGESFVGFADSSAASGALVITRTDNKSFSAGEYIYACILLKDITSDYTLNMQIREADAISNTVAFFPDGTVKTPSANIDINTIQLTDGWALLQGRYLSSNDTTDADSIFYLSGMSVGSQLYVQAAFFGKSPLGNPYAQYNRFLSQSELAQFSPTNTTLNIVSGELINSNNVNSAANFARNNVFSAIEYQTMKIRWRRIQGVLPLEFRFSSSTTGQSAILSYDENSDTDLISTIYDGSHYITTFDFSNYQPWGGNIEYQRWDVGDTGEEFAFDYIFIYSPSKLGEAENYWPAKLRANATIPITPALRVSPSDENAIEVNNPYFPARLETDGQSRLQVSSPVIYNTSLSIVEDF